MFSRPTVPGSEGAPQHTLKQITPPATMKRSLNEENDERGKKEGKKRKGGGEKEEVKEEGDETVFLTVDTSSLDGYVGSSPMPSTPDSPGSGETTPGKHSCVDIKCVPVETPSNGDYRDCEHTWCDRMCTTCGLETREVVPSTILPSKGVSGMIYTADVFGRIFPTRVLFVDDNKPPAEAALR